MFHEVIWCVSRNDLADSFRKMTFIFGKMPLYCYLCTYNGYQILYSEYMINFFKTRSGSIIATQADHPLSPSEQGKLCWLYGDAELISASSVPGLFLGPRREMISPWSTNAVEITQNMSISGISRIEEFFPINNISKEKAQADPDICDPMLQRVYENLDQDIFTIIRQPEPVRQITDIGQYNLEEGLALSDDEIDYLHDVESQLGRHLTDSEIFGFAQINSEHCRHKIFSGSFIIDGKPMPFSLFDMIKRTTTQNPNMILSAYKDNVAFAQGPVIEQFAPKDQSKSDWFRIKNIESVISLKAETHNFPTTVEPFNGAATGTGGEIRDRMGGGIGSWPIAGTAVYMTAYPRLYPDSDWDQILPVRKWLYQTPEQILIKASNGASDFGNKFGQPLIAGSVLTFEHVEGDEKYAYDKVIMLAGGVGYASKRDCLKRKPQPGNKIVVVGGDNYRIGLGGGSVSSVDTGKYSSGIELNAVQRANPEMQKRTYNLVRALCEEDVNPIVSIHDHGSAGHVNCLSELVEECGGKIDMDKLPIGDPTLSAKEIIANESQERMGILIDGNHLEHVRKIAERERAPLYVVGETTGDAHFSFCQKDGSKPFDLDVSQMFGHSPKTIMTDSSVERTYSDVTYSQDLIMQYLEKVLRLEAVACKDWLTNKVDRSVSGKVVRQQCVGRIQLPLADCGVVALDYRGKWGIATSIGHAPQAGLASPEAGAILSVAEALTNLIWAPLADGIRSVSLSANWMWPCRSQKGEDARLYKAVEALSIFCQALHINVPTGKDSLSMSQQYPDGQKIISPGTVIVSAAGQVADIRKVIGPVLVNDRDSSLYLIDLSCDKPRLGGSAFAQSLGKVGSDVPTVCDPDYFARAFNTVQELISRRIILCGHDISAGGLITTLLEMTFANIEGGMRLDLSQLCPDCDMIKVLFAENPGIVLQVRDKYEGEFRSLLSEQNIRFSLIGKPAPELSSIDIDILGAKLQFPIPQLRDVWYSTSFKLDSKQSMNGCAKRRFTNYKKQPVELIWRSNFYGTFAQLGITPDRWSTSGTKAAIIREKGTNGEREMAYALWLAGFDVKDVMMTDLISGRETLQDVNMIVFCGGFSNSDVLGSAKGWAGAFLYNPKAKEALERFYQRPDTLSLGICNGCQLMVELNLINPDHRHRSHLCHNTSLKFESQFLSVSIPENNSVMLGSLSGSKLGIWVAHGEGRFYLPMPEDNYNIVAKYNFAEYPGNPNGSAYNTAAICSDDGRHLAMMPHPERAIFPWQCGWYPRGRRQDEITPWMEAFVNAREWIENNVR